MILRKKYISEIQKWIWTEKIIILKWARQVWKTTLMRYFFDKLKKEWKQVEFLNADNISENYIFDSPDILIDFIKSKYVFSSENKIFLFIDEFQYIKNAWLFLKNIFDEYKDQIQIICSGSSSLEIAKNTEFLTWRAVNFYIDRVWFGDYFFYKNSDILEKEFSLENFKDLEKFYKIFKNNLEKNFFDYLNFWWYPESIIFDQNEKKEIIISQIVQTYIEKDITQFLKIENIRAFNNLIKILCSDVWNLLNIKNISDDLWISMQTLNKYLDILEWTFVFSRVLPFFSNTRKEISKMPKIFVEDLWIKNFSLNEFWFTNSKVNFWAEVENFFYNELRKKTKKEKIFFYRTISKSEIDFVKEVQYWLYDIFEIKYRKKVSEPIAFKNFSEKYKVRNKFIITKDELKIENWVYFIPACLVWFLEI